MKNYDVLISVIIPAYNAEKFLKEAVESILTQTYLNYEIIILNDGSTDSTDIVCKQLCLKSKKIRYYKKSNSGVSDTRNKGLELAKGKYIFFMDSDDLLPKNALETLLNVAKKTNAAAVYGNHAYSYNGKIIERVPRIEDGPYSYSDLKDSLLDDGTLTGMLFGSVGGALYNKAVLDRIGLFFNPNMQVNEDGFFNFLFIQNVSTIHVISKPYVYIYRQWKTNINKDLKKDERFEIASNIIREHLKKMGEERTFIKQLACRNVSVAFWNAIRIKDYKTNFLKANLYLDSLFSKKEVKEGLLLMNYTKMNSYKKIICFMIKHKMKITFFVVIRFIYPLLERILRR